MASDNLHIPQRLEGESFSAYRQRRQRSHNAAYYLQRGRPVHDAKAPEWRKQRRLAIRQMGLRQFNKARGKGTGVAA